MKELVDVSAGLGKAAPEVDCERAGGCGAGDVDVAGGVEGHGEADVACGAELGLGEDVGCGRVGLEEAYAVFLVEEEVEVAGGVGLDGVELGVELAVGGAEEAGEDELLRAGERDALGGERLCGDEACEEKKRSPIDAGDGTACSASSEMWGLFAFDTLRVGMTTLFWSVGMLILLGEELKGETAEAGSEKSEGERFLHGCWLRAMRRCSLSLMFHVALRFRFSKLRKTLPKYYSFPFWEPIPPASCMSGARPRMCISRSNAAWLVYWIACMPRARAGAMFSARSSRKRMFAGGVLRPAMACR
jgi:hypothetical protein